MCFNLGYLPMKAKFGKKRSNGEEESKGLLLKEIQRWKMKQEDILNPRDASSLSNPSNPKR